MSLFDSTEEYFIRRDDFIRYIMSEVNPSRKEHGLSEIREDEARECFRLLDDFCDKWELRGRRALETLGAL